ncbi:MAG: phytanoyl-CoA dioxygenase family protein [Planctomycetota bacterium]|nr:phytanoyl-CoA dioxygenase family protein [Planctomycetota bacterium]MDA1143197.1 phytanoyl-CoA dioxygenase family protein [Planctomycetota bacterium]
MNQEGKIAPEQLQFFDENGYLILGKAFGADEVRRMQAEADHILELILNSSNCNQRKSGRLDICENSQGQHIVRKIQPINDLSLYLTDVSKDPRLIEPMRQIMKDEPVLMEEKLNYKQPLPEPVIGMEVRRHDDLFPVHNDWAYYASQDYPQTVLSSAVCMDDCTVDSGPIHVWPGSHKIHRKHERMDNGLQVSPDDIDFEGGIDVLVPAGTILIFHVLMIHNSRPNFSGRPRRLMIYSHYPKQANKGIDVRNGPGRLREAPYEWEYVRKKLRGEFVDVFQSPQTVMS